MEKYRKIVGIGLILMFGALVANSLVYYALCMTGVIDYSTGYLLWLLVSMLVQAAGACMIAFHPNAQSSVLTKIGAGLFLLYALPVVVSIICIQVTEQDLYSMTGLPSFIPSILNGIAIFLILWGMAKMSMGVKIMGTIFGAFSMLSGIIMALYSSLVDILSDIFGYDDMAPYTIMSWLFTTVDVINVICAVVVVILTIVWMKRKDGPAPMCQRPYMPGNPMQPYGYQPNQPYGYQPNPGMAGQPTQPFGQQPGQPYGQPTQPFGQQPGQPYGEQPTVPFGHQPTPRIGDDPTVPMSERPTVRLDDPQQTMSSEEKLYEEMPWLDPPAYPVEPRECQPSQNQSRRGNSLNRRWNTGDPK